MSRSVRLPAPGPWGFRISGGRDFQTPVAVSKVVSGSKAELGELQVGDVITAINGADTSLMIHVEAQNKIRRCPGDLLLHVDRTESTLPNGAAADSFVAQRFQTVLHLSESEGGEAAGNESGSSGEGGDRSYTPPALPHPPIHSSGRRSVSPNHSPRKPSERSPSPAVSRLSVKEVWPGEGGRRSLSPTPTPHPEPRLTRSADSSPWGTRSRADRSLTPSPVLAGPGAPVQRGLGRVDKDSEVYKMILENQAAKEPPKQSARFRLLQEAMDSGREAPVAQFSSGLAPSAPRFTAPKHLVCEKCGSVILTEAVKIQEGSYRHHECYACADCGLNLGMRGHFWFNDKMFCEKHACQRYQDQAAESSS
ncbi:PDZ and LIM domain protein 2 [Amblyraja radiata]|uniref:PDZ and LIM domain protein 2 n=1 Tax=Amblyraja radiata TaxID=386614 RepID=UPI001401F06F|nr:PDZ and LIM domain protein 2 [Amblyraja radiata]